MGEPYSTKMGQDALFTHLTPHSRPRQEEEGKGTPLPVECREADRRRSEFTSNLWPMVASGGFYPFTGFEKRSNLRWSSA